MPKPSLFIFQISVFIFVLSACSGFVIRHVLTVAEENRLVAELAPEIDKLPVEVEYIGNPAFGNWRAEVGGEVNNFDSQELVVRGNNGDIAVIHLIPETKYVRTDYSLDSEQFVEPKEVTVGEIKQGTKISANVYIDKDRAVADYITIEP